MSTTAEKNRSIISALARRCFDESLRLQYALFLPLIAGQDEVSEQAEDMHEHLFYCKTSRLELRKHCPEAMHNLKNEDADAGEWFGDLYPLRSKLPMLAAKWHGSAIHWIAIDENARYVGDGSFSGGSSSVFFTFGNTISQCTRRAFLIAKRRSDKEWLIKYRELYGREWTAPESGSNGEPT